MMDFCEIYFWVPPRQPEHPVMRGFIDTVCEEFDIASGTPERRVVMTGRDYGKLLLNTKPYDPVSQAIRPEIFQRFHEGFRRLFGWSETDTNALPPSESPPMRSGQITDGPAYTPTRMLRTIFETFYKPIESPILDGFGRLMPELEFISYGRATRSRRSCGRLTRRSFSGRPSRSPTSGQ